MPKSNPSTCFVAGTNKSLMKREKAPSTGATYYPQADQAFIALIQALRDGDLRSGSFISMPELSRQLGYPIAAIREATKLAEARSLLHILPKRGIAVMEADKDVTEHCLDMRAMLEREGARRIINYRMPFPARELRDSHKALLKHAQADSPKATTAAARIVDHKLHDVLGNALQNPFLCQMFKENCDRIAVIQNARPFLKARIVSAMEENLEIVAAIERRSLNRALIAINEHLAQTLRWLGV